ncbi:TAXI family TRAP transporter solute-binding subunit [Streptomyces sp. NPDC000594]|uniref:TAXI family TRAP transporter solute-binding subunit n=1 Tax=Streptomyces sp. NPDC000594 TaxID=3154261 RepID=UPI00332FEA3A
MFQAMSRIGRRRAARAAAALLVVSGLLLWWLLPLEEPGPRGAVTFSTGLPSGVYERYGSLLKAELGRDLPEVRVTLRDSAGSKENIARVANGGAHFTIATADAVAKYQQDGGPQADRLRGCARLYDDYIQLVVPGDSRVKEIGDLRGLTVGIGQERSGVRLVTERLLEAAGINPAKDITAVPEGIDTVPRLLEQGRMDAFFWSGGLPTTAITDLSRRTPIRLVPLRPKLVDTIHATTGPTGHYRQAVVPTDAYDHDGNDAPVPTMAVANLLVTTDRMEKDLVEGFTRTVIRSRDRIGDKVHAAQRVDLRTAIYTDPLELHRGAQRYYISEKP